MLDRYLSAEGRFFPFYFIYLVVACALTFALRPIYRKVWRREPSVLTVGFVIVVGSIVAAYLWLILGELIFALLRLKSFPVPAKQSLLHYLTNTFVISLQHHKPFLFLSWSALYFGIKYWQIQERKRRERAQSRSVGQGGRIENVALSA
jgi:two-component system, LytTR family, sensor kinase